MKKYFLYLLIVVVAVIILLNPFSLYISGYFHPHRIFIDNIAINAPKDTFLYRASINGKEVQNFFSPLFFSNKYQYDISNNDSLDLTFQGIKTEDVFSYLSLRISKSKLLDFKKFISLKENKSNYHRIIEEGKACLIFQKKDNLKEVILYNFEKSIYVFVSSSDNAITMKAVNDFCSPRE